MLLVEQMLAEQILMGITNAVVEQMFKHTKKNNW
jgi:hypothetical protein